MVDPPNSPYFVRLISKAAFLRMLSCTFNERLRQSRATAVKRDASLPLRPPGQPAPHRVRIRSLVWPGRTRWVWAGNAIQDIFKAFTRRCVLDEPKSSKLRVVVVMDKATVDVQGVIIPCNHTAWALSLSVRQ